MSKIYLSNFTIVSDTDYIVGFQHFNPEALGKTDAELEQTGILVDSIPTPEVQEGKQEILHINPITKELFYVYVDIPKTQDQIIADLQTQNDQLTLAILQIQAKVGI